jgi:endo-1,4-beta-xylanase
MRLSHIMKSRLTPRRILFLLILMPSTLVCAQQPREILLWPGDAPGSQLKAAAEAVRVTPDGEHVVSNVHKPSITPYLPSKQKSTGAAVIVAPGGGHRELWVDHEGHNLARWLSARGIAAFVLKYRLAREANSTYKLDEHAFADIQRAIRLVRGRAKEWELSQSRVGVLGFSAGGEVAALASMRFDLGNSSAADPIERESSRPDFQALIYPGSSGRIVPARESPPVFLVCGYQDRPDISRGLAEVYLKFKEAGVPAELHVYATAGHGFGVRERNRGAVGTWPARFEEWLAELGLLKKQAAENN